MPNLERQGFAVSISHVQRQTTSRARNARPDLLILGVASFGSRGCQISKANRDQLPSIATNLLSPEGHYPVGSNAEACMRPRPR